MLSLQIDIGKIEFEDAKPLSKSMILFAILSPSFLFCLVADSFNTHSNKENLS